MMRLPFEMGWGVLLENWDGLVREYDGKEVKADRLELAEKFEQDFDAFGGGCDILDRAFHALERTGCDFDLIANGEGWGYGDEFLFVAGLKADLFDESCDKRFWDVWNFRAEADQSADALAERHCAFHLMEVEFGKKVAGKERFEPPDLASASGFAVFDTRAKDFDVFHFTEVLGRDVFALGLGANAEPFWRI